MAFNQQTNKLELQDESVSNRVTGLLAKDSPLITQARTQANQASNRRGLLNSSMAVESGQKAAYSAALPIASQEASQAHSTNTQGRDIESRQIMQGRQFGHETDMQGRQFGHETGMQGRQFGHETGMQSRGFAHDASQNELNREHQTTMQSNQFTFEGDQANLNREQQLNLQRNQFGHEGAMTAAQFEHNWAINQANLSAGERQQAAQLAASYENSYSNMVGQLAQNENIPADVRQNLMRHYNNVRNSNLAIVEQMYGIKLDWGQLASTTGFVGPLENPDSGTAVSGSTPPPPNGAVGLPDRRNGPNA